MSTPQATTPGSPPRPRGEGPGRFPFILLGLAAVVGYQSLRGRKDPPAPERIVGTWLQMGVGNDPATRRTFTSDGAASLERLTAAEVTSTERFRVESRRDGTYTFTGDDTLTVTFGDGVEETWTVQFPRAGSIHLGGTGLQGGTFVDASSLPSYAPTSAR